MKKIYDPKINLKKILFFYATFQCGRYNIFFSHENFKKPTLVISKKNFALEVLSLPLDGMNCKLPRLWYYIDSDLF